MVQHTVDSLCAFSRRVAEAFEAKRIAAPIHLCSGEQAQPLVSYFRDNFTSGDWVCSNWRSSFHCLLAGMPEEELFAEVLAGRFMYVNSAKHKIICSAIVGGSIPIATGIGMAIKRRGGSEKVHCFLGDMTATTGLYHEAIQYAAGHDLPVRFVIEDNSYSTNARTEETWGESDACDYLWHRYDYERDYPHTGTGVYVAF